MAGPVQQTTAQAVFTTTSSVPWYIFWGSVFAPIILAAIFTAVIILAYRIANRSEGNDPISKTKLVVVTLVLGAFMGAVAQWGMQEIVAAMVGIPAQYKMIAVAIIFTGPASMLFYHGLRWIAKWRKWDGLYEFLSVKHRKNIDYTQGDAPDMTMIDDEDKTEEQ